MCRVHNTRVYSLNFRLPLPFRFKGYSAILWWCLLWDSIFGCEGLVHRRSGEHGWGQFDYHTYPHPGKTPIHSSEVMAEVVNRLGLNLLAIHNEHNENNIAISPYGALTILVALGEGLQGESVNELQTAAQIPNDISTIRVGLRDIHRHLKSYFIPAEGFLAGLTLNNHNVSLKQGYKEILKFYGFDIMSFNNALYPDPPTTKKATTTTTTERIFWELTMKTTPTFILMPTIEPESNSEESSETNSLTTNTKDFTLFTIAKDTTTTKSPASTTTTKESTITTKESVRTKSPVITTTAKKETTTEYVVPTTITKDITTFKSVESIPFTEKSTVQYTTIETTTTKPTITSTITTPKQTTEITESTPTTNANEKLTVSTENHSDAKETSKTSTSLDSTTTEITTVQGITSTIETVTEELSTIQVSESFTENDASTKQEENTEKQIDSTITTIGYVDSSSETTTTTMLQTTESDDKESKTTITKKAERKTMPTTVTMPTTETIPTTKTMPTTETTLKTTTEIITETTTLLSYPYPEASSPPTTAIPVAVMDENEVDNVEGIMEDPKSDNKNYKKEIRKRRSILDYIIAQYHDNQRAHDENYSLNHPYLPENVQEDYMKTQTRPSFPSNHPYASLYHQGDDFLVTPNRPSFPLNHPYTSSNLATQTLSYFSTDYQYLPLSQDSYNLAIETRPNLDFPEGYKPVHTRPSFIVDGKYKDYSVDFTKYDAILPYLYIPHLKAGAVSFPLDSEMYYLLLLLPDSMNGVDKLICDLRLDGNLKSIVNGLRNRRVTATMPNFKLNGYVNLTPSLQKLGIRRVFEPNQADFSRMTSVDDIYITNIEQAITVNIKNYGNAGAINNRREYTKEYPIDINVIHPFLYFVMDSEYHVALMAGKIVNPLNTRIA